MTKNQIEFFKASEQKRTNLANEEIERNKNQATISLGFAQLGETTRHNVASEQHNTAVLGETRRHNLESEAHARSVLAEQMRHSLVQEAETERANRAHEVELNRSNLAREQETYRYNTLVTSETKRANMAREQETHRSNVQSEQLRSSELAETKRYHDLSIGLGYSQLSETTRANKAREAETHRANVVHEFETQRANEAREFETFRANTMREDETKRSNQAQEALKQRQLELSYVVDSKRVGVQERQAAVAEALLPHQISQIRASNFRQYAAGSNNVMDVITKGKNIILGE